jgi:hypothetical protein
LSRADLPPGTFLLSQLFTKSCYSGLLVIQESERLANICTQFTVFPTL